MNSATCHPDEKHYAKGLCRPCYNHAREGGRIETSLATCHPDRPAVSGSLCRSCYNHQANANKTPEWAASKKRAKEAWVKTPKGRAHKLLHDAKYNVRGIEFNLEFPDIVIPSHCPVLGIALDCAAERPADNLPSLDRIDNTKGYVKGNVWVISWRANFIKKDASLVELRALVAALDAQEAHAHPTRKVA